MLRSMNSQKELMLKLLQNKEGNGVFVEDLEKHNIDHKHISGLLKEEGYNVELATHVPSDKEGYVLVVEE